MAVSRVNHVQRCQHSRVNRVGRPRRSIVVPVAAAAAGAQKVERFPLWPGVWRYLSDKGLESVSPADALALDSAEWVLVDVRPADAYNKAHIDGAVSIPLYQPLSYQNANPATFLKAAAYMFNGVSPIEINPTFSEQVTEVVKDGKGVVFYCEAGGTMKPSVNFPEGKSSRSLQSCFRAIREGLTDKVKHLDGGIYAWYKAQQPISGNYDTSDVGRTPNAFN